MKSLLIFLCLLIAGCAGVPSPAERRSLAETLAAARGWHALSIEGKVFDLVAFVPEQPRKADRLAVYIEGDGFAWISGTQPSDDPTPRDPRALRLSLAHPEGSAVYLARACQYVKTEASGCASRYWTNMRFAPEVIEASNQAIDTLKQRFGATKLTLVGYSGGGAVAALVAARRSDVERLVTVAGNLDHRAWTTYHHVQPLDGSLNPADRIDALRSIPQWHFVGGRDGNITPELIQAFANRFPPGLRPVVEIEAGFDHHCCWAAQWPSLWRRVGDVQRE